MMKKLLALLLLILTLSQPASADGPPCFSDGLLSLPLPELSARCIAAAQLSDPRLISVCTGTDGAPLIVWGDWRMLAVMTRRDGLMALCCFRPDGDGLMLDWHNDLLLSYYQDIALTPHGAAWSGGITPGMELFGDTLILRLPVAKGLTLMITAVDDYNCWRVTDFTLLNSPDGRASQAVFRIAKDSLADDIRLETCFPGDWHYQEE